MVNKQPTLADLMNPESVERLHRFDNWRTACAQGWHYAKEMNCRDSDKFPKIGQSLAQEYFKQLEEGMKYLSEEKK